LEVEHCAFVGCLQSTAVGSSA